MITSDESIKPIFEIVINLVFAVIVGVWFGYILEHSVNISKFLTQLPPNESGIYVMTVSLTIALMSAVRIIVLAINALLKKQKISDRVFSLSLVILSTLSFVSLTVFAIYQILIVFLVESL